MMTVTPYERAARALYGRLEVVFSDAGLALYDVHPARPQLSYGTPVNRAANCVWLDPLPTSVSASGGATGFEVRLSFALTVFMLSRHSDRNRAISNIQTWVDMVHGGVTADGTLRRNVDSATPRVSETGADVTTDRQYVAGASVEVACVVHSTCPREFRELIRDAEGD